MTLSTFEEHLDLHGGEIAKWPRAEREAALALLAISAEAQAALQAMRDVETVLASTRATASGIDRLADLASRHRQSRPFAPSTRRAGWAAAAMVVLVMGLAVGDIRPTHDDGTDGFIAASLAASLDPTGATDVD